ncbi:MAG: MotA/TolQ/ExbB proton channel family protein [Gammaproteobacteria bacterium]|nr:MAG: MotA/TolQ/ExbB proton channel family protein [Gammaproteobacteria bacterium]
MRTRNIIFGSLVTLAIPFGLTAAHAAASLDDLLQQTRAAREESDRLATQNAEKYNSASPADQERMLREVTAERDARAASAKTLSDQYSNNEVRINNLNTELRQKENALNKIGELFGVARQTSSDIAGILQQSIINAQLGTAAGGDNRIDFLHRFAESKRVPSVAELERVWIEIQREMTESGKVVHFEAGIVQPNGERVVTRVTRIGPFTAVADGKFLGYMSSLSTLNVLTRQLPDRFMEMATNLQNATSGYVQATVDPARGVLLGMYIERPTFEERIELGEEIGYVIIVVGIAGALAFVFQLIYLLYARIGVTMQLRNLDHPGKGNPLGRVLLAFKSDPKHIEEDADVAELRISEAVLHEVPRLERFQALLRLAVAAGPLLGLIGTVWGMILTFQSITESGSSDPKMMATGIGQAMIATVLGLGIAVPLLFANALLSTLSRSMVQILDEQSAGLLAESLEKRRRA